MNEVWRVLKPGGIFYAVTPAYPMPEAFQDPTHVNIITDQTHHYFCRDWSYTSNYGFKGRFEIVAAKWVHPRVALNAIDSPKKSLPEFRQDLSARATEDTFPVATSCRQISLS